MRKKIRADRDKELIKLHNTGKYTLEQLGNKYGVTRERVRQILKRNGITKRYGYDLNRIIDRDKAKALREQGLNLSDIARKLSCSISSVRHALHQLGINTAWETQYDKLKQFQINNIVALLKQGYGQTYVSILADVHEHTIKRIVREHGLQRTRLESLKDPRVRARLKRNDSVPQETKDYILELYTTGVPYRQIQKLTRRGAPYIIYLARKAGVFKPRKKGKYAKRSDD